MENISTPPTSAITITPRFMQRTWKGRASSLCGRVLGKLLASSNAPQRTQTPTTRRVLVPSYPVSLTFAPVTTRLLVYVNTTFGGSPTSVPRLSRGHDQRALRYLPPTWTLPQNSSTKVGTSAQSPLPGSRSCFTLKWPNQEQPRDADLP